MTKLAIFYVNVPSVQFSVSAAQHAASLIGISIAAAVPVPPTATDMTPFVARALSSGANGSLAIIGPADASNILKQLLAHGRTAKTFKYCGSLVVYTPPVVAALGVVNRLLEVVRRAADGGIGVLLVEQHILKALALADRVYIMRHGEIQLQGTAADLRGRIDDVQRIYFTGGGAPA